MNSFPIGVISKTVPTKNEDHPDPPTPKPPEQNPGCFSKGGKIMTLASIVFQLSSDPKFRQEYQEHPESALIAKGIYLTDHEQSIITKSLKKNIKLGELFTGRAGW